MSGEDVGDATKVKKKKKMRDFIREMEIEDLRFLLDSNQGRAFLWRLVSECGIYRASPNEYMERFEGQRDIGLWLLAEIHAVPGKWYSLMAKEAQDRDKYYSEKKAAEDKK